MMDTFEFIAIREGETTICPEGKQLPFIPSETARIGFGGYGTI
jgi:hypothetical protein